MTIKLSELAHIKTIVPNAERAYQILHNIFGAEKLKEDFVNSYVKVVYVGIGDFILQYIEPLAEYGPWYDHLQTKGPGIYSLAFGVENIKEVVGVLENEGGIIPVFSMDKEMENFPSEFLNPKIKTEYIMNTMEKIGQLLQKTNINIAYAELVAYLQEFP